VRYVPIISLAACEDLNLRRVEKVTESGRYRMEEKGQRPDYADRDDPVDGDEEPEEEPTEVNPLGSEVPAATEEELEEEKKEHGVEKEPEIQS